MLQLADHFKGATLMSRGIGHVEKTILDLLRSNQHMSSTMLAAFVYQTDEELTAGGRTPSRAESSATRRALASLQRKRLIIKLGHMVRDERCSYATPENAFVVAESYVKCFGTQGLKDHPELLRVYLDHVAPQAPKA